MNDLIEDYEFKLAEKDNEISRQARVISEQKKEMKRMERELATSELGKERLIEMTANYADENQNFMEVVKKLKQDKKELKRIKKEYECYMKELLNRMDEMKESLDEKDLMLEKYDTEKKERKSGNDGLLIWAYYARKEYEIKRIDDLWYGRYFKQIGFTTEYWRDGLIEKRNMKWRAQGKYPPKIRDKLGKVITDCVVLGIVTEENAAAFRDFAEVRNAAYHFDFDKKYSRLEVQRRLAYGWSAYSEVDLKWRKENGMNV